MVKNYGKPELVGWVRGKFRVGMLGVRKWWAYAERVAIKTELYAPVI
jgi:hypothetical protein